MCGGIGTRLRPLTFERPKPAISLLNKPSIAHLVEHLSDMGFNNIVLTLGYLGEKIEECLGDGSSFGVTIQYVHEKEKLGTAGGVKNAEKYLSDSPFLVVGGDHVLDLNLREFYQFHRKHDGIISVGLLPIDDPMEYGIAEINVNNRIKRFIEKPAPGQIFTNLASTGIYVCDPEIFDLIPEDGQYDFAKDLFPALLRDDMPMYGWLARGSWMDLGCPKEYRAASKWMLEKLPGIEVAGHLHGGARLNGPVLIENESVLGTNSAIIGPVIIGADTIIGNNVLIGPYTTIGDGCRIGDGTQILSSYIYDGISIGDDVFICGAIIDDDAVVENNCVLENGTVIGPRVTVRDGTTIHSDVRIWPEVTIDAKEVREDVICPRY